MASPWDHKYPSDKFLNPLRSSFLHKQACPKMHSNTDYHLIIFITHVICSQKYTTFRLNVLVYGRKWFSILLDLCIYLTFHSTWDLVLNWESLLLSCCVAWPVTDPGFPMGGGGGGAEPLGGTNLWCGHFSAKMYAKMKELDPVRGVCASGTP